eukprot:scaffold245_cov256-Pinguiococcus_pyrenoidosus.AAC.6
MSRRIRRTVRPGPGTNQAGLVCRESVLVSRRFGAPGRLETDVPCPGSPSHVCYATVVLRSLRPLRPFV